MVRSINNNVGHSKSQHKAHIPHHHFQTFMNFAIFLLVRCIACLIVFISMHISHTFFHLSLFCYFGRYVTAEENELVVNSWEILVCWRLWSTINLLIMWSSDFLFYSTLFCPNSLSKGILSKVRGINRIFMRFHKSIYSR